MPVTKGQGNPNWSTDETLLVLDLLLRTWPTVPGASSREVGELSNVLRRLRIHGDKGKNEKFRNADGVYMKLQNLASLHPDRLGRFKGLRTSITDRAVWERYWARPEVVRALVKEIKLGVEVVAAVGSMDGQDTDDEMEAREGTVLTLVHRVRERHKGFRGRLLKRVEREHGSAKCEACSFSPAKRKDGSRFASVLEAHHNVPLAAVGSTQTKLSDLSLLCANCHRLVHALMRDEDRHVSVAELKRFIAGEALVCEP